jgi:hypothetical protein
MKIQEIKDKYTTATESDVEIIRGRKNTGKTTYLIEEVLKHSISEVVFVHPSARSELAKTEAGKDIYIINSQTFVQRFQISKMRNITLIIDEAKAIINTNPAERFTSEFIRFLSISRHLNTSVYLVYHHSKKINDEIFNSADRIRLFKSEENIKYLTEKLQHIEGDIISAQELVNKNKSKYFSKVINI